MYVKFKFPLVETFSVWLLLIYQFSSWSCLQSLVAELPNLEHFVVVQGLLGLSLSRPTLWLWVRQLGIFLVFLTIFNREVQIVTVYFILPLLWWEWILEKCRQNCRIIQAYQYIFSLAVLWMRGARDSPVNLISHLNQSFLNYRTESSPVIWKGLFLPKYSLLTLISSQWHKCSAPQGTTTCEITAQSQQF